LPWLVTLRPGSDNLAPVFLVVFFLLLALNVARCGVIGLREARESARNYEPALSNGNERLLRSLAVRLGVPAPHLTISERHPFSAYVFGWRRPMIMLGKEWLARLDPGEKEALFAHELAHFKRGDNWLLLVARVCRDLMFFNPLAHYVYHLLLAAREEAADDLALRTTRRPLGLASCLLKFWQAEQPVYGGSVVGLAGANLEPRIHRLLNGSYADVPDSRADRLFYALSIILAVALSVV
jgi:beta-lactamase regulating signal transducer with metallopeptidase domain